MKTTATVLLAFMYLRPAFALKQTCEMIGEHHEFIVWSIDNEASSMYLTRSQLGDSSHRSSVTTELKKLGVFVGSNGKTDLFSTHLSQSNTYVSVNYSTRIVELVDYFYDKPLNLVKKTLSDCQ